MILAIYPNKPKIDTITKPQSTYLILRNTPDWSNQATSSTLQINERTMSSSLSHNPLYRKPTKQIPITGHPNSVCQPGKFIHFDFTCNTFMWVFSGAN